jgi:hypothetical protein
MPTVSKLTSFRVPVSLVEQCCSLRWYLAARVIQLIVAFASLKRQKENQNIDEENVFAFPPGRDGTRRILIHQWGLFWLKRPSDLRKTGIVQPSHHVGGEPV